MLIEAQVVGLLYLIDARIDFVQPWLDSVGERRTILRRHYIGE